MNIEIYSDVVCPWCYLGKRRLDKALQSFGTSLKTTIHYLPFELNPATPAEGIDRKKYLTAKYGSSIEAAEKRLTFLGKEEGVEYHFDLVRKIPNTFNAHRVIWLAGKEGLQGQVVEALFSAYFTEGKDLGDTETLRGIAAAAGLNPDKVEKLLNSEEGSPEVREMEERAYHHGISGVPHFIFGDEGEISGAQPVETFISIFSQLKIS